METLDNHCPTCGAAITFDPKSQKWNCQYCGSKFTIEEMKKFDNASSEKANAKTKTKKTEKKLETMDIYHCKSCGAEVMADETTTATFCVYCGNTAILKDKIIDGRTPSKVIPFKKVEEDAVKAFEGLSKGRPLMPKLFNKKENIEKIRGVYIPFWAYDIDVNGKIDFDAKDVSTWSDYNYRYEKTDTYLAKREGNMSFQSILADASSHFDDNLMDSLEPFHFDELVEYNHAYMAGFLAEKYDVDSDKAVTRANERAMNTAVSTIKESVHHQISSVKNNNLATTTVNEDYILLPVWMVNIKYKEKMYTFAMNGQTGEIVGNIPIDIPKTIILFIVIFAIIFAIVYFFVS